MYANGYRADIDGLRGFAVLAVLAFHLDVAPFSGGYVGVDIFFVLSGFLITRLIVDDLDAGTFSFKRFYLRRLRRLFPAAFVTLVAAFLASAWLLSPPHMEAMARATLASLFSVSNFLFWSESGYFDTAAELKPLLHTWSLSVEEQFYFVWPALLVGLSLMAARLRTGFGARASLLVPAFLVAAGLISLIATEWWLSRDPAGAFFLPFFRIAEFAIGALTVWAVRHPLNNRMLLEALALIGWAAMLWPAVAYTAATRFPGLAAMLPCLGTALLIYAGRAPLAGRIADNRLMVGIGLISYSLYLVHWPIIVLYRYWTLAPLSPLEQAAIAAAAIGLATAMYFWVETPIRRPRGALAAWRPRTYALVSASLALVLTAPVAHAWLAKGWDWRFATDVAVALGDLDAKRDASLRLVAPHQDKERFTTGRLKVLVIGDSHGVDFSNALLLDEGARRDRELIFLNPPFGCQAVWPPDEPFPALPGLDRHACDQALERFMILPALAEADYVIFAIRWWPPFIAQVEATLRRFQEHMTGRLVIAGRTAEFPHIATLYAAHGRREAIETFVALHRDREIDPLNATLRAIAQRLGAAFIDRQAAVCPRADWCHVFDEDGNLLYYDYGHWTLEGARFFATRMRADDAMEPGLRLFPRALPLGEARPLGEALPFAEKGSQQGH